MISRTDWATIKNLRDENEWCFFYVGTSPYTVLCGDHYSKWFANISGADATDFDSNYKSNATSVAGFNLGVTKINSGGCHIFMDEVLADGVYEDSMIIGCDFANKTFTIENKNVTNGLFYRIWGSANNTDFEEIKAETLLAASTKITITKNDFWKYVKMQAKGNGGAATIDAYLQVGQ